MHLLYITRELKLQLHVAIGRPSKPNFTASKKYLTDYAPTYWTVTTINEVLRFLHNMIMASQLILGDCPKGEEWPESSDVKGPL